MDQIIGERFGVAPVPGALWRTNDGGMHVLAAALFALMKDQRFDAESMTFRDWLLEQLKSGRLAPDKVRDLSEKREVDGDLSLAELHR